MAKLIFYPLGNADTTLIHLNDGRLVLKDFFRPEFLKDDKRIDLRDELGDYVRSLDRDYIDVVLISHADDDHLHGAEDFFWLEHSEHYQGGDRIKINDLHVPSNFIVEPGLEGTAKIIQQEARHRLKEGRGILIYGFPYEVDTWFKKEGIDPKTRNNLLIHAGQFVPGFSKESGNVEIFVHAPFSFMLEGDIENRNDNSIVLQLTFFEAENGLAVILGADAEHETWANIVKLTKINGNQDRLDFDLFRISHHCSYTALSSEKGDIETTPREEVAELFENGNDKCLLISSSWPISTEESIAPPHFQAKAFYKKVVTKKGEPANFLVTMEEPDENLPKPIIVETSRYGLIVKKTVGLATASQVIRRQPPKVG